MIINAVLKNKKMRIYNIKTGHKGFIINKIDGYYGIYWTKGLDYYWNKPDDILFDIDYKFKFSNYE